MKNPLHEIFIPEAEENLLILEERIIGIEKAPDDKEIINDAFRAIHSIKGGAGLAGFPVIKEFTHVVEDLMELIRSNVLSVDKNLISILLKSLDIIKSMVDNISNELEADQNIEYQEVKREIQKILQDQSTSEEKEENSKKTIESLNSEEMNLFHLDLNYYPEIFISGNNPAMYLDDLRRIGEILFLSIDISHLPPEADFDPEKFYLSWKCFFRTNKDEKEIHDIFCFVIDESNINIHFLNPLLDDRKALNAFSIEDKTILDFISFKAESKNTKESSEGLETRYKRSSDLVSSSYIRVQTDKLERIFNTVSELIISEAHLNLLTEEHEEKIPDEFVSVSDTLKQITRVLQEQVTSLRMMSLRSTFDRFKRVVRDLSMDLGKNINLILEGQDTELDKNMIEKLNDPIKHIIRNSIDHGIETEEERIAKGKPAEGTLKLAAYIEDGKVIIEISDDGRGINTEKLYEKALSKGLVSAGESLNESETLNLVFHPGLSTAGKITDLSGRGVGMDVVKKSISDLNGNIDIRSSKDEGTVLKLFLPLTLAILDGMLVDVGQDKYIIPTLAILEIFRPEVHHLKTISSKGEVVYFRGDYIPLVRIHNLFNVQDAIEEPDQAELIVVQSVGGKAALLVDNVLEQFQVVLKSLQQNFRKVENVSSATILGNGDVALILDVQSIVQNFAMGRNV